MLLSATIIIADSPETSKHICSGLSKLWKYEPTHRPQNILSAREQHSPYHVPVISVLESFWFSTEVTSSAMKAENTDCIKRPVSFNF